MSLPEVIRLVICGRTDNDRSSTRRKQICNCTSNSNHITAQHSSDYIPASIKDVLARMELTFVADEQMLLI